MLIWESICKLLKYKRVKTCLELENLYSSEFKNSGSVTGTVGGNTGFCIVLGQTVKSLNEAYPVIMGKRIALDNWILEN